MKHDCPSCIAVQNLMGHPDSLSIKCLFPQKFSHVSPSSSNFESKFLWESWHLSSILEPRIQGHESCIPHLEHVWTTSQNPEQRWCGGDRKRVEQWNAGHPQGLLFTPPPVGLWARSRCPQSPTSSLGLQVSEPLQPGSVSAAFSFTAQQQFITSFEVMLKKSRHN